MNVAATDKVENILSKILQEVFFGSVSEIKLTNESGTDSESEKSEELSSGKVCNWPCVCCNGISLFTKLICFLEPISSLLISGYFTYPLHVLVLRVHLVS